MTFATNHPNPERDDYFPKPPPVRECGTFTKSRHCREDDVKKFEKAFQSLHREMAKNLQDKEKELSEAKGTIKSQKVELDTLSTAVKTNTQLLEQLQTSQQATLKSNTRLQQLLDINEEKLKATTVTLTGRTEERDALDGILTEAIEEASGGSLSGVSKATRKLSETFEKKRTTILKSISTLREQAKAASSSVTKLKLELQAKEAALTELKDEVSAEKSKLEKEIQTLNQKIRAETAQEKALNTQLQEKEAELTEAKRKADHYKKLSEDSHPIAVIYKSLKLPQETFSDVQLLSLLITYQQHISQEEFGKILKELKQVSYCVKHYNSTKKNLDGRPKDTIRGDRVYQALTNNHIGQCDQKHSTSPLTVDVKILKRDSELMSQILSKKD